MILSFETGFEGDLEAQITKSAILDFVSRCNAVFSARTKIVGDLEVHFTFSGITEFVKWAKKIASKGVLKF